MRLWAIIESNTLSRFFSMSYNFVAGNTSFFSFRHFSNTLNARSRLGPNCDECSASLINFFSTRATVFRVMRETEGILWDISSRPRSMSDDDLHLCFFLNLCPNQKVVTLTLLSVCSKKHNRNLKQEMTLGKLNQRFLHRVV